MAGHALRTTTALHGYSGTRSERRTGPRVVYFPAAETLEELEIEGLAARGTIRSIFLVDVTVLSAYYESMASCLQTLQFLSLITGKQRETGQGGFLS